ncbi:PH domain-containing protein [Flavobacterium terrigena]|uniref:PH domain-containing protein n=1 Tax=Flavobacterium terrigena TaxID=402734 RepID=A0A1H6QVF1_9FLAO|nr:PH domain-containing protein [Flavobacterium terrigena]SEI47543.1 PH domain-containing protein [Flavobacterium terrigena]
MQFKSGFSKINFTIPLIPVFIILIISIFTEKDINLIIFPALGIYVFIILLFTILFYTTYYEIREDFLIVSLFFYKTKIKTSEIRSIKYSNSIIKTNLYKPGFDHKGIEIRYHKYDDIFISPKNRDQFIAQLQKINPNIEIIK